MKRVLRRRCWPAVGVAAGASTGVCRPCGGPVARGASCALGPCDPGRFALAHAARPEQLASLQLLMQTRFESRPCPLSPRPLCLPFYLQLPRVLQSACIAVAHPNRSNRPPRRLCDYNTLRPRPSALAARPHQPPPRRPLSLRRPAAWKLFYRSASCPTLPPPTPAATHTTDPVAGLVFFCDVSRPHYIYQHLPPRPSRTRSAPCK